MHIAVLARPAHRPVRRVAASLALLAVAGCGPTEPSAEPLVLRASLGAPSNVDLYVSIPVRLENFGTVSAFVPQCHAVQRLEGRRWVDDAHLGGACGSVPPETIPVGAAADRVVDFLRSRLPAADSTVLRVRFQVADDASYEPARVITVYTAPVTVR